MNKNFRPGLRMIADETIKKIIEEALSILKKIGILVENQEALRLLKGAGMVLKENRVLITEDLVRTCLKSAPSTIKIYDRAGNLIMDLADDNVYFVPGSTAVYFLDSEGEIRKPTTQDYINLVKLTDFLPNIMAQSTAMIPADVPDRIADQYRLYLSLCYSQKPIVTGTFSKESFEPMKRMLTEVRGSEEELRRRPLAIFDACPSPPLKWSDLTCQALMDCAKSGIPADIISVPLAGAVSPVTLYGALIQHTAENLSGLVISQLAMSGAPVIYGGSPAIFDMRDATAPLGAIESLMLDCGYQQIGKYLGLPTHTYMGLSDSKDLDSQMGMEAGIGIILAAICGINVVSGAGMLGSENCQSLEKLMLDNELCGMALRLISGISPRDKFETEEILGECLETGNFISHAATLRLFREEQYIPESFIDRTGIEAWKSKKHKKGLKKKLREEVGKVMRSYFPSPLDEDIRSELFKLWTNEASKIK